MGNVNLDNLSNTYTYDAEGRQITVNGKATTFDTFNRAIEIQSGIGSYAQVVYSPSGQKFAFMNGTTLVRYKAPMAAVRNGDGTGYFQHADWLGSSRFAHDGGGNVKYDRAYAPFGEVYAESGGTTNRDFTGQTQDTVSGLYDFLLRQQSSAQGRWLVPDPAGLAAVDITNPQTWNRYAYVANSPLSAIDPLGLEMCDNWWGCLSDDGGGGYTDTGYCPPSEESCGDDGVGSIGIVIGIGGGGGGGVGGGTQLPGNPPSQPMHFPDETLGIPNGFPMPNWGILSAFLPSDLSCPAELSPLCSGIDPALGEDPWQNARIQELANGITQRAGQLSNPCTIGLFYGASAAGPVLRTVNATATATVTTAETYGIPATAALSRLYQTNPAGISVWFGKALTKAHNAIQSVCTWIGEANW